MGCVSKPCQIRAWGMKGESLALFPWPGSLIFTSPRWSSQRQDHLSAQLNDSSLLVLPKDTLQTNLSTGPSEDTQQLSIQLNICRHLWSTAAWIKLDTLQEDPPLSALSLSTLDFRPTHQGKRRSIGWVTWWAGHYWGANEWGRVQLRMQWQ